jgi:hypothetical protein
MRVVRCAICRIAGLGELDALVSVRRGVRWCGYVGSEASYAAAGGGAGSRTVSLSVEDRQQAVTALMVMIEQR